MIDPCFNAYILFCDTNLDWKPKTMVQRRLLLENLSTELKRKKTLPQSTGVTETTDTSSTKILHKRKRCTICPTSKDTKTSKICKDCKKHVCPKHYEILCLSCYTESKRMYE